MGVCLCKPRLISATICRESLSPKATQQPLRIILRTFSTLCSMSCGANCGYVSIFGALMRVCVYVCLYRQTFRPLMLITSCSRDTKNNCLCCIFSITICVGVVCICENIYLSLIVTHPFHMNPKSPVRSIGISLKSPAAPSAAAILAWNTVWDSFSLRQYPWATHSFRIHISPT